MHTSSQGSDSKKRYGRLIGPVIGLALFGLVLSQLGPRQILGALKELDYRYILVACAMFAVSYSIKVSKWYFMQRRAHLSRSLLSIAHLYVGTRVGGLMTPLRSKDRFGFSPGVFGFHAPLAWYCLRQLRRVGVRDFSLVVLWYLTVLAAMIPARIVLSRGVPDAREAWRFRVRRHGHP